MYNAEDLLRLSNAMSVKRTMEDYSYSEDQAEHRVEVSMLGHSSESVKVHVEDGYVNVKTEPVDGLSDLAKNYSFKFKLPKGADPGKVSAEMANGVLKIVIKKNEANRFEVKVK